MYCLVVTDDYSRFTWVFFLATKDETSGILKSFITRIETLVDYKVKVVRCDNGTEFKNRGMRKFDGKADEGFFVGWLLNSKAFGVFNSRARIVEENLHIRFSENTPNVVGSGLDWLFDIDALTRIINYEPIIADPKSSHDDRSKPSSDDGKKVNEDPRKENECKDNELSFDPNMPALEDVSTFNFPSDDEDDGTMANLNNSDTTIQVSHILTTRIHKDYPLDQVIEDLESAIQTRNMSKNLEEHGFVSTI
nr:putative ribonuclease H-like domain-containing protein [Tanacetum cinerariifolium]